MDAVFAFLYNPIVLALVGLAINFVPGLRSVVTNKVIWLLNTLLAWLAHILGPAQAVAAGGPLALGGPVMVGVGFFGLGNALNGLGGALWQATQAWIIHKMILKNHLPKEPSDSI